jgi:hypothetical protein
MLCTSLYAYVYDDTCQATVFRGQARVLTELELPDSAVRSMSHEHATFRAVRLGIVMTPRLQRATQDDLFSLAVDERVRDFEFERDQLNAC